MTLPTDVRDIFSIFHDGSIVAIERTGDDLRLRIDIPYLAELVEKDYEYFNVLLKGVSTFDLNTWGEGLVSDPREIAALEVEILNAIHDESGKTCIYCEYGGYNGQPKRGGTLVIDAKDYELYDQGGERISLDEFKELSTHYWKS